MTLPAGTIGTDHVDTVTHSYIHANVQDMVYNAFTLLNLMYENAQVVYHGGTNSLYPYIDTGISANYYTGQYAGTIGSALTPTATNTQHNADQPGWSYWYKHEAISHEEVGSNVGDWANSEAVISLKKIRTDSLLKDIGYMFDENIAVATGSNYTIGGLASLYDITNADYLGWDFTGTDSGLRPARVTISTSYTSLVLADLFEAYGDIEDMGRYADFIVSHPDILKKLRTLTEATVKRDQGGSAKIGQLDFDVLKSSWVTSRALPTTTSTKIYFMNFGNHPKRGIRGNEAPSVPEGKNWLLEFAGPKGLGMSITGWFDATKIGYPGVLWNIAYGAFKMACTKPMDQAYIAIA